MGKPDEYEEITVMVGNGASNQLQLELRAIMVSNGWEFTGFNVGVLSCENSDGKTPAQVFRKKRNSK